MTAERSIMIRLYVTASIYTGGSKMDRINVGMKLKLAQDVGKGKPVGTKATVVYIDDFDQVFVEWADGGQDSFDEFHISKYFEVI